MRRPAAVFITLGSLVVASALTRAIEGQVPASVELSGIVTRLGSDEPIAGARVTLAGVGMIEEVEAPASITRVDLNDDASDSSDSSDPANGPPNDPNDPLALALTDGFLPGGIGSSTIMGGDLLDWFPAPGIPFGALPLPGSAAPARVPRLSSRGGVKELSNVRTDEAGRFSFKGLKPGRYRVSVAADGFVLMDAPGTERAAIPVGLAPGQSIRNLAIGLTPTGSIEGRIQETGGELLQDIPVYLWRYRYRSGGSREIQVVGHAVTDDRGWYRIFWIPPGEYFLAAGGPLGGEEKEETETTRRPVLFHPGHADGSSAEAVSIAPGGERTLDWTFPLFRTFRIRARITDSRTGGTPSKPNVEVFLVGGPEARPAQLESDEVTYDEATGVLEIPGVVSGAYAISVSDYDDDGDRETFQVVRVKDQDVDGVVLDLSAKPRESRPIRGRITVEGGARFPSMDDLWVAFRPELGQPRIFRVESDGRFTVSVNPSREKNSAIVAGDVYRASVTFPEDLPGNWYVSEAKLDGADALGAPLRVNVGARDAEIRITLSPRAASVEGVVQDRSGRPVPGVRAVLIPKQMMERPDLYAVEKTGPRGDFTFRRVPPGDYAIYAWPDDVLPDENSFYDRAVVERFAEKGAAVHVSESSRARVTVTVASDLEAR